MRTVRIFVVTIGLMVLTTVAPTVAADDPAATATYVTGTIAETFGPPPELLDDSGAARLVMVTESEIDWSDPRLPSRMVSRTYLDSYEGVHPDGALWPSISASSHRLEGPDGTWTGVGHGFDVNREWLPSDPAELMGAGMITLTGEGTYEDLSAVLLLHLDALDYGRGQASFEGFIYEGEPPPMPEPIEAGFELAE